MKVQKWIFTRILSLFLCMAMVLPSSAAVSAKDTGPDDVQPERQYVRIVLNGKLQTSSSDDVLKTSAPVSTAQAPQAAASTVVIMSESFEGKFPEDNNWFLADNNGPTAGEYLWGATSYRAKSGAKSGWEAVGGADGYDPSTKNAFPGNLETIMIYGPFSLVGATEAKLNFSYWSHFAGLFPNFGLGVLASLDNNEYNGITVGGNTNNQWTDDFLDLSDVDGNGLSFLGQPEVYVLFGFQGQGANTSSQGIYVDDIVLEMTTSAPPTCYSLNTSVSPMGGGSITASPAPNCNGGYTAGTQVQLTATANSGYTFANWSGDASGSTSPVTVTMNADQSVTANFTQQTCYTLTTSANPSTGGSVSKSPAPNCGSTQYTAGTQVQLTATANSGYTFKDWSGSVTSPTSPVTVTMDGNKTVTANFTQTCYTLNVSVSPSAGGTVSKSPEPNCSGGYTAGTQVQLTANANTGYSFTGWSGDSSGTTSTVTVTMDKNRSVTASFAEQCFTLTKQLSPTGGGTISSSPAPDCGSKYKYGTQVELTASANSGYIFDHWSGAASGTTNPVTVTMTEDRTVTANFTHQTCYTLTTYASPSGGGSVSRSPEPNCNDGTQYLAGTKVQLTAAASSGYAFKDWTGDAAGTTSTVTVTMDGSKTATANFTPICYNLDVSISPSGGGSVNRDPLPNCNGGYAAGTQVTLTATPNSIYNFDQWTGAATGTSNTVTVKMDGARSVTANFTEKPCYTLATSVSPSGGGSVSKNLAPNCGSNQYRQGTQVELNAEASSGYNFASWSGDASGSENPTTVVMDDDKAITANFTQQCFTLTLAASPSAGGSITSSPEPNCEGGKKYAKGTQVELTAAPNAGYVFKNWSGAASGSTSPVTISMTGDKSVTATFEQQTCYTLTTSVSPSSGGTVSLSPAPNCGSSQYTAGTQVKLTAVASSGYTFANWSGGATGTTNPVNVTMNGNKTVTANFTQLCYTLTVSKSPTGGGSVDQSPAPNCKNGTQYTAGTQVQLTAAAKTGYMFANWSGDASGTINPITVTMSANRSVTANFTAGNPKPTLASLNTIQVLAGSKDTPLTLTGTGFISGSKVTWNETELEGVQYISSTELRVIVPEALLAAPGKVQLAVVNPGPGGGTSNIIELEIIQKLALYLPCVTR